MSTNGAVPGPWLYIYPVSQPCGPRVVPVGRAVESAESAMKRPGDPTFLFPFNIITYLLFSLFFEQVKSYIVLSRYAQYSNGGSLTQKKKTLSNIVNTQLYDHPPPPPTIGSYTGNHVASRLKILSFQVSCSGVPVPVNPPSRRPSSACCTHFPRGVCDGCYCTTTP